MSSFREFKDFKSDWKPKKRIPVVRTLIVLALIYAVYASGAAQKAYRFIEDQRKIPVEEPAYADLPWPVPVPFNDINHSASVPLKPYSTAIS